MTTQNEQPAETYYREAGSWAEDRTSRLSRSRRIAWILAAVAAGIALMEALALMMLAPLKTVVPYTLLVDRQTGFVQAVDPINPQRVSADTALTQSFLAQYVVARESFDIDSVQAAYRRVSLWSAERARADYLAMMQGGNLESPLARYPRSAVVETVVRSVSSVAPNVASVRFETRLRGPNGQWTPLGAWAATIRYRFAGEPMRAEDRFENPLGFQVLRYRRDQEAVIPPPVVAVPQQQIVPVVVVPPAAQRPVQAPARPTAEGQPR